MCIFGTVYIELLKLASISIYFYWSGVCIELFFFGENLFLHLIDISFLLDSCVYKKV